MAGCHESVILDMGASGSKADGVESARAKAELGPTDLRYHTLEADNAYEKDYLSDDELFGFRFPNIVNCVAVVYVPDSGDPNLYMGWHCPGATMRELLEIEAGRTPREHERGDIDMLARYRARTHGKIKIWGFNTDDKLRELFGADKAVRVIKTKKYLNVLYVLDPGGNPENDRVELTESDERWLEFTRR